MYYLNAARPTWAEIDLENLAYNFHSVKKFVGDRVKYMAVVKANAYGHGAVPCSVRLEAEGVDWFGVAIPEEGVELRKAGLSKQILCLGGFWPGQESLLLNNRLTPVVYRLDLARVLNALAEQRGTSVAIHIKIDTGMGRIGVRFDEVLEFLDGLRNFPNLRVEGLMTHFAVADDLAQNTFTELQVSRFNSAVAIFREHGHNPAYLDLSNSPGAIAHPGVPGNMVRLGGVLYGLGDDVLPTNIDKPELRPVLSLKTEIAFIKRVRRGESLGYGRTFEADREMKVATLPIGYQDGYNRLLSNRGRVIIRGIFCRVIGRISMDWTIVDITDVRDAEVGDTVTMIGNEAGQEISSEDIAATIGTISYEVTCSVDRRVPRVYNSGR